MRFFKLTNVHSVEISFAGGNQTTINMRSFNVTKQSGGVVSELKWEEDSTQLMQIKLDDIQMIRTVSTKIRLRWR